MLNDPKRFAVTRQLPIRKVAMREGLLMVGDHAMPLGKRHWRATASAFVITDFHHTPMLWIEGDQVVGEMAITVPKPEFAGKGSAPAVNETLLWFEVVPMGGMPVLRTWWARGKNINRTQRVWRIETFDPKIWPERMKQLLQLMGWVN